MILKESTDKWRILIMNYSKDNCPLIRCGVHEKQMCIVFDQPCIKVDIKSCDAAKYAYDLGFRAGHLAANEEMLRIQTQRYKIESEER